MTEPKFTRPRNVHARPKDATVAAVVSDHAAKGIPARVRVLIVDDHEMFREALRRMLQAEPGIVVAGEASRGGDVMKLVAAVPADVLLLDWEMPGGSGLEALKALSAAHSPVRTILVTGFADRQQVVDAIRYGARGIVGKDASVEVLVKSIRQVMAGDYWIAHDRIADLIQTVNADAAKAAARRPADTLTKRELQIVFAIAQGAANKEIGAELGLSEQTVKNHLSAIFDKLGVSNRLELALYAVNHRLIESDPK